MPTFKLTSQNFNHYYGKATVIALNVKYLGKKPRRANTGTTHALFSKNLDPGHNSSTDIIRASLQTMPLSAINEYIIEAQQTWTIDMIINLFFQLPGFLSGLVMIQKNLNKKLEKDCSKLIQKVYLKTSLDLVLLYA